MAYGLDVGYVRGGYKRAGLVRCMRNDTLIITATQRRDRVLFERGLKPHDRNRKLFKRILFVVRKGTPVFVINKFFITWSDTLDCLRGALPEPERQPYLNLSPYLRVAPCRLAARWLQRLAFKTE